jgi:aryl-alcohol dehydrogenase-like predicted oxidoreductase
MKKRSLGNTGISVSEIAFGGVEIGMPYGIGKKSKEEMLSEREAVNLLHQAVDSGINFFDTARLYGNSEQLIGQAFRSRRDEVVLCTKCVHFKRGDGSIPTYGELRKIIEDSVMESLKALRTDYVDVFMLHSGDTDILENDDVQRIFTDLMQRGLTRSIGVSVYQPEETNLAINSGIWNLIQLPFNLMDQRQAEYFDAATEKGIGIVVRSVLLQGLLSERGRNLHPALGAISQHIEKYRSLLDDQYADLPSLATKFALSFEQVSSVLVGIDSLDYLNSALAVADRPELDAQKRDRAIHLAFPQPDFINLHTWNQQGWLN